MPIKIDAYHHADMKLNPKVVYVLSSNWTGYSKSQKEKKKIFATIIVSMTIMCLKFIEISRNFFMTS